jgi:peptidoglycan/xylan/chitin deacetylase (PgdA/CDA1 family)
MLSKVKSIGYSLRRKIQQVLKSGAIVLLYHRVIELDPDPQLLAVSPDNFDAHLAYLKKKYTILSVAELEDLLEKKKKIPKKSVALTFDDGYADNYKEALPILEKYNVQALFYICTGNLNTNKEFWWDEIERILLISATLPDTLNLVMQNELKIFNTGSLISRKQVYEQLLPELRILNVQTRNEIITQLRLWSNNNVPRESNRSLSFKELQILANSENAVIGAHTHNHPSLASVSHDEQIRDVEKSKNVIKEIIGVDTKHFSFPFGTINDFSNDTIEICQSLGFEIIAANIPKVLDNKSNKLRYPRFLVRNWNERVFAERMEEFFSSR